MLPASVPAASEAAGSVSDGADVAGLLVAVARVVG